MAHDSLLPSRSKRRPIRRGSFLIHSNYISAEKYLTVGVRMRRSVNSRLSLKLALFLLTPALAVAFAATHRSAAQSSQDDRQLQRDSSRTSASERRTALVIGNGAYTNAPQLKNPPNDATLVATTLKKLGFEVSLGTNKSQREMKQLIRE